MKTIISASRRTDIPAFHSDWLLDKIKQGNILVPNPFNKNKYEVSLLPEDVGAFVFWSKNYKPAMKMLRKISPIYDEHFLFHYTITGYENTIKQELEPNSPVTEKTIDNLQILAEEFGAEKIFWRYDPIIFLKKENLQKRLIKFEYLVEKLADYSARCYISFLDLYNKVIRRLKKRNIELYKANKKELIEFVQKLESLAADYNLPLYSCCEPHLLQNTKIKKGHCIDSIYLSEIYPDTIFTKEKKPTREGCGCFYSRDIGVYNTCEHKCLYCYANH